MLAGCDRESPPAKSPTGVTPTSSHNVPRPANFPTVPAAPKPPAPLPPDAGCVTPACHATFAKAATLHGPVAMRNCTACHETDQGDHHYPLKRTGDATCTYCHTVTGHAKHQHKALAGGCISCHDPHVSRTKNLLVADSIDQLCNRCHNIPWQKYAHEPFKAGHCTLCHEPHESNFDHLLRGGDGPAHCFNCHADKKAALDNSAHIHKPARDQCTTCHNPHTSDNPYELRQPINATCLACHTDVAKVMQTAPVSHEAMVMSNGCANCHDAHASTDPNLLKERSDKLCLTCHDKPAAAKDGHTVPDMRPVLERKYLHGPVRSGDCTSCHEVHGSTHARLLVSAFPKSFYAKFDLTNYTLCFTCHSKELVLEQRTDKLTGFRNGDENLHYVHVHREERGRTCKTCHDVHGGNLPDHVAETVPFENSDWALPINFTKSADGGSCAPGCHEAKTYKRDLNTESKAGEP